MVFLNRASPALRRQFFESCQPLPQVVGGAGLDSAAQRAPSVAAQSCQALAFDPPLAQSNVSVALVG
jgi:hypothetical protein